MELDAMQAVVIILDLRLWCKKHTKRIHLPSLFCLDRLSTIWESGTGLVNEPIAKNALELILQSHQQQQKKPCESFHFKIGSLLECYDVSSK